MRLTLRIRRSISASPASPAVNPAPKSSAEQEPDRQRSAAIVQRVESLLDDLETVHEDLGEEEREDADGEHREGDPCSLRDELDPAEGQTEVDREPGQRAEQDCLAK